MASSRDYSKFGEDIAVIRTKLENLDNNFSDFKEETKGLVTRVNDVENKQIAVSEKVSNLAIFQSIFSVITGAIATYLGVSKK